ncbi:AsnC family transcriptional regulator [Roseateles noduli]|nr:AsnC family transcriptional regulator [Roseateles noduli]
MNDRSDKKPARTPNRTPDKKAATARPTGTVALDAIDLRILEALQRDGRMSNVDLATQVHLSAPQCFRRVRALEERGVLRGYRADVAPLALGLSVTAYVSLNITAQAFVRVREIESLIRDFPEILECHTVSGDSDYLLKVVARDLQALSKFLTDKLMQLDGVADVRSMICLEEIKPPAGLPVD